MDNKTKLAIFNKKEIRKTIHNDEWWFSVTDVVFALTDSEDPSSYLKKMRSRDKELLKGWGQIVTPLLLDTKGGKQKTNCANTEGIFRVNFFYAWRTSNNRNYPNTKYSRL